MQTIRAPHHVWKNDAEGNPAILLYAPGDEVPVEVAVALGFADADDVQLDENPPAGDEVAQLNAARVEHAASLGLDVEGAAPAGAPSSDAEAASGGDADGADNDAPADGADAEGGSDEDDEKALDAPAENAALDAAPNTTARRAPAAKKEK